jgi:hypothetical protein
MKREIQHRKLQNHKVALKDKGKERRKGRKIRKQEKRNNKQSSM